MIIMISCQLSVFTIIYSIFTIISEIILLLVSNLLDDSIYIIHWFYHFLLIYFQFYSIISSINLLFYLLFWLYKYEWYYQNQYWYQNSFQILVIQWNTNSILIMIVLFIRNTAHNKNMTTPKNLIQITIHRFYQLSIYTLLARIGETSIHSFIFIQILVIDLNLTCSNERGR